MAKKNLLYLMHCYHNRGGVEEHTRALAKGLAEDFNIDIVAPENGKLLLIRNGAVASTLPADKAPWPITPYDLPQTNRSLEQFLNQLKPDLIHVQHFFEWHIGLFEQLTRFGVPVISSFHDYYAVTPVYTMQGAPSPAVALGAEYNKMVFGADITEYLQKRLGALQKSLAGCSAFVVPSNYLAQQLSSVLPFPYRVIEHGIDAFIPLPLEPGAEKRFGFVGSKLPQKGWMELLKAFQILREKHTEAELYFFGGGQQSPEKSSPGVQFFESYTQENLPQIMAQFEIGVIPSLFAETFSYVLSEQWMGGKAVAASRIGALGERITDGVNGKLFIPGKIDSMVETLSWFLESESWRSWKLPEPRSSAAMLSDYRELYNSLEQKS